VRSACRCPRADSRLPPAIRPKFLTGTQGRTKRGCDTHKLRKVFGRSNRRRIHSWRLVAVTRPTESRRPSCLRDHLTWTKRGIKLCLGETKGGHNTLFTRKTAMSPFFPGTAPGRSWRRSAKSLPESVRRLIGFDWRGMSSGVSLDLLALHDALRASPRSRRVSCM
jgi:hypothetical protein